MSSEMPSERKSTSRDFTHALFSPTSLALLVAAGAGAFIGGVLLGALPNNRGLGPIKGPAPSAPIIARGGALTFRSFSNQAFVTANLPANNYCVVLPATAGASSITVGLIENPNNPYNPPYANPPTVSYSATLDSNAQFDFFGHPSVWWADPSNPGVGAGISNNGVRVTLIQNCNGHPGILFQPEPAIPPATASNSAFYADRLNTQDDDGSYQIRFQDTSCATALPSSTGDEDNCEHLSAVYYNPKQTSLPKSGKQWLCTDGECDIVFQFNNPNVNSSNRNSTEAPIPPAKQ
jgi:hypothetical protein